MTSRRPEQLLRAMAAWFSLLVQLEDESECGNRIISSC